MTTKSLRYFMTVSLFLLALGGIALYLWHNQELLALLTHLSWPTAVSLIILRLLFVGLNGLFLKLFAAKLDVHLNWYEWVGLPFVTTMGNYLTPLSGGMLARAAYLKNRHALSYTHFTTLLAANYLITFWVSTLTGLCLMPLLWQQTHTPWLVLLFFVLSWGTLSVVLLIPMPHFLPTNRLTTMLQQAATGWQAVRNDRHLMWQLVLLTIVSLLLNAAAFWLGYQALQVTVSAPAALMISLSTVFSALTTITPGNFGIREAFISFMSEIVGVGVGTGLLVALLIRGSTLVSAFTLGPLFSVILAREVRLSPQDNAKR
jgi:uncharacterized membrane protein YbhN (UPF0104 family)